MARILLILVLLVFLLWTLRNFLYKLLYGARRPARFPLEPHKEQGFEPPVDLVRDEETGKYRVKEDSASAAIISRKD